MRKRLVRTTTLWYLHLTIGLLPWGPPCSYEVELFKLAAQVLARTGSPEWAKENYTFLCIMDWDQM